MPSKQKIRIKFTKGEEVKYISHLDMVRAFTRTMRRARLPIATTCGFVPRERISFSPPLSLGLTSKSEYADIEFFDFVNPEKLKARLNEELPSGLEIEEVEVVPLKGRSLMATFDCAEYEVKIPSNKIQDTRYKIQEFLKRKEIFIQRATKKGIKEINIRPLILKLELRNFISDNQHFIDPGKEPRKVATLPRDRQYKENCVLKMLLRINVKPQEITRALLNLSKEETLKLVIERKDLFKI